MDLETLQKNHADLCQQIIASERDRLQSILTSEEAKGCQKLAQHLALNSAMSAKDVLAVLACSPQVPEASTQSQAAQEAQSSQANTQSNSQSTPASAQPTPEQLSGFAAVMASIQNPDIDPAGDDDESDAQQAETLALRVAGYSNTRISSQHSGGAQ